MSKIISNLVAIIAFVVAVLGGMIGALVRFASGKEPVAKICNRMNEDRFLEEC